MLLDALPNMRNLCAMLGALEVAGGADVGSVIAATETAVHPRAVRHPEPK